MCNNNSNDISYVVKTMLETKECYVIQIKG